MKNFKPQVIGHYHEEEKQYKESVDAKTKRFNELFTYVQQFISIEDVNAFKDKFTDEFLSRFYDKHHANFPTLSIEKTMELHGCQMHRIEALYKAFTSIELEWDFDTNTPTEIPDFRILTKNESENNIYNTLSNIIDSIEKAQEEGMTFYPSPMLSGFNGWMQYDFNTGKIVPNISRIQGTEINF